MRPFQQITMPMPPSVNALWRIGKGRMFRSKLYTEWIEQCKSEAEFDDQKVVDFPFYIHIKVGRKINKDGTPSKVRMDIDNRAKSAMDALQGMGVIVDDCLAEKVTMEWTTDHKNTKIKIYRI